MDSKVCEIKNLIQCIGPHVVVSTNGKITAPFGLIPLETKLLASIHFFAGGSAYNIFPLFGMAHTSLFRCVWAIVQAINKTPDMRIDFPMEHFKQQQIAHGFMKKALLGYPRMSCLRWLLPWGCDSQQDVSDHHNSKLNQQQFDYWVVSQDLMTLLHC